MTAMNGLQKNIKLGNNMILRNINDNNYWAYTKDVPPHDKVEVKANNNFPNLSFYKDEVLIKTVRAVRLDKKC